MQEEGANITVNSVHPGLIMTDLMRHSFWLMSKCLHADILISSMQLERNVQQNSFRLLVNHCSFENCK